MIEMLRPAVGLLVIALLIVCPLSHRGNGRHVSRKLRRLLRVDRLGAFTFQTVWVFVGFVLALVGLWTVSWISQLVLVAWLIDDALTGGPDDDDRRKRERAKVRLRMPKPVNLRPVERWAAPA